MGELKRSERNIAWLEEFCYVPDGKFVGQPIVLRDWQREIIEGIYDSETRRGIVSVGRKNAKALALDTPIPTPTGWRQMQDIAVGDFVYAPSGQPVRVIAESEVFPDKPCYQVSFSDGSSVVASGDHLWMTRHSYRPWVNARRNGSGNGGRWRMDTVTTAQIAESLKRLRQNGENESNHKIEVANALESKAVALPIAPYVLGAWLGDGTSASGTFTCSEDDLPSLVGQFERELGRVSVARYGDRAPTIRTPGTGFQAALSNRGLLGDKRIPEEYFDAGTEQRWALLQGLMDTDGSVSRCGGRTTPRCTFSGANEQLTFDVWRLARSLGLKATRIKREAKLNGNSCGPYWQVSFPASSGHPVFRLDRKQALLPDALGKRSGTLTVTECAPVESVPTKCIAVDSEDHLFLCGYGCIPTHNTALSALLLLLHLVGPEVRRNSELYSTALSREQAAIIFRLASKVVRLSPELSDLITIRDTVKQLHCEYYGTLYQALSADASTAMGLSPVFTVHDELGQVRGPRHSLYEALETATAAQENPLSIIISTQAPTDADLLSVLIDDASQGDDPRTKLFFWAADPEADPFDVETIKQANPAFGDFQNSQEVLDMAEGARRMPSREAEYRNLILNQRVEAFNPFVTKNVWDANGKEPEPLEGVYGGLDLSETNDLTALLLASPNRGTMDVKPVFWLPEEGIEERAHNDRVPYDVWAKQGFIKLTPGRSVEYEFVAKYIAELFQSMDIRGIAFDRWNMKHLRPWLLNAGVTEAMIESRFHDFGQGYVSMSPALRNLESLLLNEKIRHGNHPVLNMCAANAVVKMDEAGNRKLDKKRSSGRIDGLQALAMAAAIASEKLHERHALPVSRSKITERLSA